MAESLQPGSGTWGPAQPAMLSTLPSPILILKGLGALPADKMCVCVCVCVCVCLSRSVVSDSLQPHGP